MKKVFLLCFLIVMSFNLFAKEKYSTNVFTFGSFFDCQRILDGEIELLDKKINYISLATLNKDELRILRNMIYARYGKKFNSEDLKEYFTKSFEWYKPEFENVDSKLTEIDKANIEIIQLYENKNKNALPDNFELYGMWQVNMPIVASGYSDRYYFSSGRTVSYYNSQMDNESDFSKYEGKYSIRNGVLEISIQKIFFYEHSFVKKDDPFDYWTKRRENSIVLENPIILEFPIYDYGEEVFTEDLKKGKVKIGSMDCYLVR